MCLAEDGARLGWGDVRGLKDMGSTACFPPQPFGKLRFGNPKGPRAGKGGFSLLAILIVRINGWIRYNVELKPSVRLALHPLVARLGVEVDRNRSSTTRT